MGFSRVFLVNPRWYQVKEMFSKCTQLPVLEATNLDCQQERPELGYTFSIFLDWEAKLHAQ